MIALVQRVARAHVEIGAVSVGAIGAGMLVLVCAEPGDTPVHAERLVSKLLALRIFSDAAGKMNLSVQDTAGGLLLVSQFTLAADTSHGNRPGFSAAAPPELGRQLFDAVLAGARAPCASGRRRLRRRHAGASGQRRPGDDSAHDPLSSHSRRCRPGAAPSPAAAPLVNEITPLASVEWASPMRALSCATVQAAMPASCRAASAAMPACSSPTPASLKTTRRGCAASA
jgi:D-tyrosyl-tRNA(Tyr) deacylase